MSDAIEIGWTLHGDTERYYFHEYRKKESMKTLFPFGENEETPDFFYCPPVFDYYKNCFGYYAISDVNILVENGQLHFLEGHKHSIPEVDGVLQINSVFGSGNHQIEFRVPDEIFISDTPNVTVQILPHPLAKYQNIINAEFDIYKWFRSVHIPYYHDNSLFHYQVNKGDPLCLIKFNTPNNETVKLVELDYEKVGKYCNPRQHVQTANADKRINNIKKWTKYFNIFAEKRPKKLIDYARIDK